MKSRKFIKLMEAVFDGWDIEGDEL